MSDDYTLGLLVELRKLASDAADTNSGIAARFHDLLRQVSSSNTPDVAKELTFRVEGFFAGTRESLRIISINGNIEVARAAYETAKRLYPDTRWVLFWDGWVVEDSMPID